MKDYLNEIIQSISDIVKIDSSQQPAIEGMPFGKGAADCLAYFLSLAEKMGFATKNYDNYVGEVLFGEGEDFAVLCHLDVVPAGDGWTYPPFGGVIDDGKIYGRGTTDDKGPAIVCLYCLKALKDKGYLPNRKIHLIVGCNEESGWQCIEHYNECAKMPDMGFSPDADFPVIYAEKGIFQADLFFPIKNAPFTNLYGGERANMVCAFARAEGVAEKTYPDSVIYENNTLTAHGKAAHGSTPDKGENALEKLLRVLASQNDSLAKAYDILFADKLKLKELHDETGYLTMSPDIARFSDDTLIVTTDIRVPATIPLSVVENILDNSSIKYEKLHIQQPLYNEKTSVLVSTLQEVYQNITGDQAQAVAIGGGTYARALKNGAAFGPQFSGEEYNIHGKNEFIPIKNLQLLFDIYLSAIRKLTQK